MPQEGGLGHVTEIARSKGKFRATQKSHYQRRRDTVHTWCLSAVAMEQSKGLWRHRIGGQRGASRRWREGGRLQVREQ